MRLEKKRVLKEDGRYLLYYHFPDTATPEQTGTFEAIEASGQTGAEDGSQTSSPSVARTSPPDSAHSRSQEDERRV